MFTDFVLNGQATGEVAQSMASVRWEPGLRRPYRNNRGELCVSINTGRQVKDNRTGRLVSEVKAYRVDDLRRQGVNVPNLSANATSLRKEDWIMLDDRLQKVYRQRLRAWADLASMSSFGGFNGMSKMTLEYEVASDPGEAIIDFDGLSAGRTDTPLYKLRSLPLPIIHGDFTFSERNLAVSRNSGTPLDTHMGEAVARRIAETVEQLTIGTLTGPTYATQTAGVGTHDGTSTIYGYTNFPSRNTYTSLATPTGSNPEAVVADVLDMIELLQADGLFGPYMLYHSTGYSRYLNDDYFRSGSTSAVRTLKERILEIDGISDVRRLDYLTSGYQMILIQMTPDVARAINGMDLTTVMWESKGGMQVNFKVMCIQVPQLFSDYNGNCGIVHGTTS